MKSKLLRLAVACTLFVGAFHSRAIADWAATQGSGLTFFAFTCFTSKICPAHVNTDNAGTEIFTTGAPGFVKVPSGGIASGAVASGAYASGAFASGSVASGAFASGSIASGALASGSMAAGSMVDLLTMRGTKNGGTAAANSMQAGGVYNSTPLTLTDTQQASLQFDANGFLKTNVTNTNTNDQKTMSGSSPVVIASDQTAVAVKNNGAQYETVAASQTGQALGATGGTGDYLSHCVIYPASTSPGVVTVFDNTNAAGTNAIAFAGGATSTSNLTPIAVPVGAISTAGAWKVTTGANVSVTCYGKFT